MQIKRKGKLFDLTNDELYLAHREFVTSWMTNTLMTDFDVPDESAKEFGSRAYDIYASGRESMTEYEAVGKAFEEFDAIQTLDAMTFIFVCDRPIRDGDSYPYYISPGGYELTNGKSFDFTNSSWYVNEENLCEAVCEVIGLDVDFCRDCNDCNDEFSCVLPTKGELQTELFSEFFMYTGEYEDPEIHVKEVKNLIFHFSETGTIMEATKEQIKSINDYIKSVMDFDPEN